MARFTMNGGGGGEGVPGPQGPQGIQGEPGADALWNYRGAWSPSEVPYYLGDVAYRNGTTWYAMGTTNEEPGTGEDWNIVALQGDTGADGEQGIQGPQGEPGDMGAQGMPGEIGFPAFLYDPRRVFENQYTTGEIVYYGGQYWICENNNDAIVPGTDPAYWSSYSLVGPQGDQGIQGEPGSPGADGATGSDGLPGSDGAPGADGDSAYQVAVTNGFIGTESEWLASLVGAQGPQGEMGTTFHLLGNLPLIADLDNVVNPQENDAYLVEENGHLYVYDDISMDWIDAGEIVGPQGPQGEQGIQGDPGPQGVQGDPGEGVPVGGNAGDILAKVDGTDYNTEWIQNYTSTVKHTVKNVSGSTISLGTPVYTKITNNSSNNIPVDIASNASEATSSKTMGLIASTVLNNEFGFVITEGLLEGIDTSTANTGDPVWLGANGALIFGLSNKPVAPAHLVFIGIVTRGQTNNGEIFVKVQNGFELDELHTVLLESSASISDNEILAFDSSSGLWKNQTPSEAGFATIATTGSYDDLLNKPTLATESYVNTAISNLVASAPSLLNTLDEIAAALNDDPNFATTITNLLALKANISSLATVATSGSYNDLINKPTLVTNLDGLSDVTITGTPTNQQLLVYDNTTSQWKNADPITSTGIAYKAGFPASKTSTGTTGQISIDGANGTLYVCTSTNTWQKVSLNGANFTNAGGFI